MYLQVTAALETGGFKPNLIRIVPNGLVGVEGGLEKLKAIKSVQDRRYAWVRKEVGAI